MREPRPVDAALIWSYLTDAAAGALAQYFNSGKFTGGRFEHFAGGGDRHGVSDQFTSDDIVAVSMLSVRIPGRAALLLLDAADEYNSLLALVPVDVDLWDVDEAEISPNSAADRLWTRLVEAKGIGWVTAGKLLARKRPRLIPVYDRVVRGALGRRDGEPFWLPLRTVLREDDSIVDRLRELRATSEIGPDVSLLRTLDVAIWMQEHGQPEAVLDAET